MAEQEIIIRARIPNGIKKMFIIGLPNDGKELEDYKEAKHIDFIIIQLPAYKDIRKQFPFHGSLWRDRELLRRGANWYRRLLLHKLKTK